MGEWFESWFDSEYYHILYEHRDEVEASAFINQLITFLQPNQDDFMLDLACGKGRHAVQLSQYGYHVVGYDLSENSIATARRSEHQRLKFFVQDMRKPFKHGPFDHIFSFFTSFGYFESDRVHQQVLNNIAQSLRPKGIFVLDFLNAQKAISKLPHHFVKEKADVHFSIYKSLDGDHIRKRIDVRASNDETLTFEERVRAFSRDDLASMLHSAGLELLHVFGSYQLDAYDAENSDRLILISQHA